MHPQESGAEVSQGPEGVITSPAWLGPVFMWDSRTNYQRLRKIVSYFGTPRDATSAVLPRRKAVVKSECKHNNKNKGFNHFLTIVSGAIAWKHCLQASIDQCEIRNFSLILFLISFSISSDIKQVHPRNTCYSCTYRIFSTLPIPAVNKCPLYRVLWPTATVERRSHVTWASTTTTTSTVAKLSILSWERLLDMKHLLCPRLKITREIFSVVRALVISWW